jgi:hypothetical protein
MDWVCKKCSKFPEAAFQSVMSGLMPGFAWICTHCQRTGLPSLRGINKTLGELQSTGDRRLTIIEDRMENMEQQIDSKIKTGVITTLKTKLPEITKGVQAAVIMSIDQHVKDKVDVFLKTPSQL